MKYLLAPAQSQLLVEYAKARVLLVFDFDGTLAPIATDRQAAKMRPRTRLLLAELGRLYPCVVLSGRSRRDTANKTRSTNLKKVVGNHGLDLGNAARYGKQASAMLPVLRRQLRAVAGIDIENKRLTIAVHYRRSRDKRAARKAIMAAIAALPVPVRLIPGKQLVNLLPGGAPGKGQALQTLRRQLRVNRALYVGDDVTDEEVFALKQRHLLSVRIGRSKRSHASYFLRDQLEIDRLLRQLIALRSDPASAR
jgi:trehalose 6-phosphate phosphatase